MCNQYIGPKYVPKYGHFTTNKLCTISCHSSVHAKSTRLAMIYVNTLHNCLAVQYSHNIRDIFFINMVTLVHISVLVSLFCFKRIHLCHV